MLIHNGARLDDTKLVDVLASAVERNISLSTHIVEPWKLCPDAQRSAHDFCSFDLKHGLVIAIYLVTRD
jgi:hypothetical protein